MNRPTPDTDMVVARVTGTSEVEPGEGWLPLSPGQREIWLAYQRWSSLSGRYNITLCVRVRGALNQRALAEALQVLMRRHPMLRTQITVQDGQPRQRPDAECEASVRGVDARGWDAHGLLAAVDADCMVPFDVARGRVMRACV